MSDQTEAARFHLERMMDNPPAPLTGCTVAAAALLIREGLDNLTQEINRPLTPDEAFGPQKDDMAPPA